MTDPHATHPSLWRRTPLLTSVFVISILILCLLSLRQHRQLQSIKELQHQKLSEQSNTTYQLITHLVNLQDELDHQIQGIAQKHVDQRLPDVEKMQRQDFKNIKTTLNELTQKIHLLKANQQEENKNTSATLLAKLGELTLQVEQSKSQVQHILKEYRRSEDIVAQISGGVCLIQGEYEFVDPESKKPLRYMTPEPGSEFSTESMADIMNEFHPVGIDGKGDALSVQYTGTGFLIDRDGFILTNKHVTQPWEVSKDYQHILVAGYVPQLKLFRCFFPGHEEPFEVDVVSLHDSEDIGLLKANLRDERLPVLECSLDRDHLKVGQTVMIVGYPTGFDVLLARMNEDRLEEIIGGDGVNFDTMARRMASRDLIWPIATQGICGRVHGGKIVYDAQTAIGGSGAPVLGSDGKVVGVNTALMKGFSGSNFGIHIEKGIRLLKEYKQSFMVPSIAETNRKPHSF